MDTTSMSNQPFITIHEPVTGYRKRFVEGRPSPIVLSGLAWLASLLCCGVMSADTITPEVDQTRATLEKWVETRRIISQEKRDWQLGREMLNERIELFQREIESLRSKIDEAEKSISDADQKRLALIEENEKLKTASAALDEIVVKLEDRTRQLLNRLPDPIRDRVKPLSQRIPDAPQQVKLSLAERFQNVVGILNEVNKFNREISVTSEVRSLPDGTSAEVTTLYIGIGQAFYVSANEKIAGVGTASRDGWVWTPANQAAPQIARAIAILKNEQVAAFVQLPIEIQK